MTVGERIKQRRLELGYTQDELAQLCGYKSRSSINKIELERDMPLRKVEKIAAILDCTPAYLMGWEEADYSEDNGAFLGTVLQNKAFLNAMKKAWAMPESKKETLYSYIDFLCATNQR